MAEKNIEAGSGSIGLLMMYADRVVSIPLLRVIRIPIIGTQYELTDMARIEEIIDGHIESLIDINEDVGVLADFGSVPIMIATSTTLRKLIYNSTRIIASVSGIT